MIVEFNQKYKQHLEVSKKLVEYLSLSSRYWNPQLIFELYTGIFAFRAFGDLQET